MFLGLKPNIEISFSLAWGLSSGVGVAEERRRNNCQGQSNIERKLKVFLNNDRGIVTTKPKGVAKGRANAAFLGRMKGQV